MTGVDLWLEALRLVGRRFDHCGRSAETGVDCIGLILVPAWELRLTNYQPRNYSREGEPAYLLACLEETCVPVEGEPQWGDIGLFAPLRYANHLAYLSADGRMIHANRKAGKVCLSGLDDYWRGCLLSVWRWKALVEET